MGKLIKYELRGNYRVFSIILIIMSLLHMLMLFKTDEWGAAIMGGITIVNACTFLAILIISINIFKNEMYDDRGYLTFTLPISGNEIMGAKLISSMVWFLIAGLLAFTFGIISAKLTFPQNLLDIITQTLDLQIIILTITSLVFSILFLLVLIFFSITISKVTFKNKKIGKILGFVVFILLSIGINWLKSKLAIAFPYDIKLIGKTVDIMYTYFTVPDISINIASIIYNLIVFVLLFLGTGYMIDNKIDL